MKSITTLVPDIEAMLRGAKAPVDLGAFANASAAYGRALEKAVTRNYESNTREITPRWGKLWASEIGSPCHRKIAYRVSGAPPDPVLAEEEDTTGRFLMGDIIEATTIALVKAAGHTVTDEQQRVTAIYSGDGSHLFNQDWTISGKTDCTIDGIPTDVKSAHPGSFAVYKKNGLSDEADIYGYKHQVAFYSHFGESPAKGTGAGALLFADKATMDLHIEGVVMPLDRFNRKVIHLVSDLEKVQAGIVKTVDRYAPLEANGKLPKLCDMCEFQRTCWGNSAVNVSNAVRRAPKKKVKI